ncbi:hypothetical protein MGU_10663 [Metarhizium guizhouense ARSEF 977]|uniref:Uncharacterized protein n=1 Tax=Metarhizium guizhouense (strain ARSEF 977) TaxID=1276136 RepID=A0A0B4HRA6_METGA|nr:hypothetical protein MGU_10663 [Metarhizium guizhouense ARSEF 977]
MESSKNNMPSSLIIKAYNPSTQYQSIANRSEAVSKVDDCARELEAAVKRLLKRTEQVRKAEQGQITIQKKLQALELENATALHRIHEMEEKYLKLEAITLEKDEQIRQSWQALQTAAQSNSELEQGRNLAIAVAEETQQTANAYETWAKGEVERALQSSDAAHDHAKRAEEEMSSAVNRERESYHAREVAERRAEDAEQARHEAEKRAEDAEQARHEVEKRAEAAEQARHEAEKRADDADRARLEAEKAKALAEKHKEELERNQVWMITSTRQAEARAEKAEADLALAIESEKEVRRQLDTAAPVRHAIEPAISLKRQKKGPSGPNKKPRLSTSAAHNGTGLQSPKITWHDERLQYLTHDLDRVVDNWGAEEVRYARFTFSTDSVQVNGVEKNCEITESSHLVRCVRHAEEIVVTIFDVMSLARKVYLSNLDLKAAEKLLRANVAQTVSGRYAQKFKVGEETKRVTLFLWTNLAGILNKVAEVYHAKDAVTVSV